jgi:hypothetical protein
VISEVRRLRYPPNGDVEEWVRTGGFPPDHVRYTGGPVEWDQDPCPCGKCPNSRKAPQ